MGTLLRKIFGGKRRKTEVFLEEKMRELLKKADIKLSFDLKVSESNKEILIDLFGEDESLVKNQETYLLDALQLFLKRATHNRWPEEKVGIIVDCDSYRAEHESELIHLAEKLKSLVLKKKKPVYFRALPPRERKIVHQVFSGDRKIRTKSVGEGIFKKIKISWAGERSNTSKHNGSQSGGSRFEKDDLFERGSTGDDMSTSPTENSDEGPNGNK